MRQIASAGHNVLKSERLDFGFEFPQGKHLPLVNECQVQARNLGVKVLSELEYDQVVRGHACQSLEVLIGQPNICLPIGREVNFDLHRIRRGSRAFGRRDEDHKLRVHWKGAVLYREAAVGYQSEVHFSALRELSLIKAPPGIADAVRLRSCRLVQIQTDGRD